MDLAIRHGHAYVDGRIERVDIGVHDGRITTLGSVPDADRIVDATDCLVLPGLVNAHTHAAMTLLRGYADDLPLQQWLEEHIWPVEAALEPADIAAGARLAALEMIRSGTTAFADMYFGMPEVADVVNETGLRALLGYGMISAGKSDEAAQAELETGIEFAQRYDGQANGRIRTMITPHAPYTCDDWMLEEAASAALDLDCPLHIHVSETKSEVDDMVASEGVRPVAYLDRLGCWEPHSYIAHGVHLEATDRTMLANRRVGVAHCPSANMKLAAGIAPIPELIDTGVVVGLGTDGPASNNTLDLFTAMRHAALVAKVRAEDAAVVPATAAIDMATTGGASLLGLNSGRIAVGRPADFAILDLQAAHLTPTHDLRSHVVYAASGADVVTTIVDGSVLMEDRNVTVLDEDAVMAEAESRAAALVARAQ